MPYLVRLLSDVVAITALCTIAVYHFNLYYIRQKIDSEPSDLYFALLLVSMALYIFFDNTLSLLFFDPAIAARINTGGVAFSSFSGLMLFLLFMRRVLGLSQRWRNLMYATGVAALLLFITSFQVWRIGYLEYMNTLDMYLIIGYIVLMIIHTGIFLRVLIKEKKYRDTGLMLLFGASYLFIISIFIFRVLISIDIRFFEYNNHIASAVAVFFLPILLLSKSKKDLTTLMELQQEVKKASSFNILAQRLPSFAEQYRLSFRELEVLEQLVAGLEYKEIASVLGLSLSGVKKRVHSLYRKTAVGNRTEMIHRLLEY